MISKKITDRVEVFSDNHVKATACHYKDYCCDIYRGWVGREGGGKRGEEGRKKGGGNG